MKEKKKTNKGLKIALIIVLALLCVVVLAYAYITGILGKMNRDAVSVTHGPQNTGAIATPDPQHITTLTEEEYLALQEQEGAMEEGVILPQDPENGEPAATAAPTVTPEPYEEEAIYSTVPISDNIYNVIIFGDDARADEDHGRSDTMILCSFNRETGEIKLASFLRDMLVPIENKGVVEWSRLNTAYNKGGPGKAINTINLIASLDLQRYVIIRFDTVFTLIDEIGGIDIEMTQAEADYVNAIFPEYTQLKAGTNHMNGRQALAYARARKVEGSSGDFNRTDRQKKVIMSAFQTVVKSGGVGEYLRLINFAAENVKTNITVDEMITIGMEILTKGKLSDKTFTMPAKNTYELASYNRASILNVTDFNTNIDKLHKFLYGKKADPDYPNLGISPVNTTPTPTPTPEPSELPEEDVLPDDMTDPDDNIIVIEPELEEEDILLPDDEEGDTLKEEDILLPDDEEGDTLEEEEAPPPDDE